VARQKERYYIRSREALLSGNHTQAINELQKLIDRFPDEKEAFHRMGVIYQSNLRQPDKAIVHFNKVIEIDPLFKVTYNQLAYCYNQIGDFEKSIWAINKYISLAPDEPNPYDSRAELYAYDGKLDQAIESYREALEKRPDFYLSLIKLGHMYLFKREYAKAESCYQELSSSTEKDIRSQGRTYLAYVPLYQGKLERALEVLDDGIAADRMEQAKGYQNASKHFSKALIYQEKINLELALKETEKAIEIYREANPDDPIWGKSYYVSLLAENNDFEKAEEVVRTLKKDIEENDAGMMSEFWCAMGCIKLARGNFEASIGNFEKAAKDVSVFWVHYWLSTAYLETNRLGEAVAVLEKALSRYDEYRALVAIWAVKAHYLLGLAYEKSGWNKKAIDKYEEFLDIWKDADPGMPEVEDAKQRLAKLKTQS
jgi:tetratricopeptide (TPR) repeat protein